MSCGPNCWPPGCWPNWPGCPPFIIRWRATQRTTPNAVAPPVTRPATKMATVARMICQVFATVLGIQAHDVRDRVVATGGDRRLVVDRARDRLEVHADRDDSEQARDAGHAQGNAGEARKRRLGRLERARRH